MSQSVLVASVVMATMCVHGVDVIGMKLTMICSSQVLVDFVRPKILPTRPTEMCSTTAGYMVAAINLFDNTSAFRASFTILIGPFIK